MNSFPSMLLAAGELTWMGGALSGLTILGLLVLSGLFSGSEAVLFSRSPTQIHHDATSPNRFRRLAASCMANPKHTLMVILVANTAVNILMFSVSFVLNHHLAARVGDWIVPVVGLLSILLVVVFGEVVPKVLGVSLAGRLAPYSAVLVKVAGYPCGPIGRLIDLLLVEPINRVLFADKSGAHVSPHGIRPDELKALLEVNRHGGLLEAAEDEMLREIINLGQIRVREVMVPRVEIAAHDVNAPLAGLLDLMRRTRLKKIPVYDGAIDQIIGLIYAKVLFFERDKSLRDLVTPVRFVPELITCEQVLHHFRDTHSQIAIAVDEFGGVAGLVALEDVLENIVGEIYGPHEEKQRPEIERRSEREYDISGRLSVHYWSETFQLPALPERVTTVGGLVTARLGRPARVGDRVQIANIELEVTELAQRRIERLDLRLLAENGDEEGGTP